MSVTYLGHEVGGDGIPPKKNLLEAIRKAPAPKSKDEIRSFLGMAEFYSKFVRNFATKHYNMRQLLKVKQEFLWNDELEKDFLKIKNDLISALPLQAFDNLPCSIITTDASGKGLGAVLSQVNDRGE